MQIGTLDRRIRFERRTTTVDPDYGTPVDSWVTVATVWANVQEMLPSKGERLAQELKIAERPARVRIRYRDDITSDMRVIYLDRGNREMKIVSPPVELGRRDALEFMVTDYSTSGAG